MMRCPVCGKPLVDSICREHGRFTEAGVPVPKIVSPFTTRVPAELHARRAIVSLVVLLVIMGAYLLLRMALGE